MKQQNMIMLLSLIGFFVIHLSIQAQNVDRDIDLSRYTDEVSQAFNQKVDSKLGVNLQNYLDKQKLGQRSEASLAGSQLNTLTLKPGQKSVFVTVILKSADSPAASQLENAGLKVASRKGKTVVGEVPLKNLEQLAAIKDVHKVKWNNPSLGTTYVGLVDAQGDSAMLTNVLRAQFLSDGTGVKIGIISNSFDSLGAQQASVLAGDLPGPGNPNGFETPVHIVNDFFIPIGSPDEGRAMAELIHDVAPGAEIAFNNFPTISDATFATAVDQLVAAGCDIIVDDVGIFTEPVYQDGLAARAIDAADAAGVAYFSAAGNSGRSGIYERLGYSEVTPSFGFPVFDYDPDPNNVETQLRFLVNDTSQVNLVMQWDEPWFSLCNGCAGAQTELDYLVFYNGGFTFFTAGQLGGDAINSISLNNNFFGLAPGEQDIVVVFIAQREANQGTPGRVKLRDVSRNVQRSNNIPFDREPTSLGHQNSAGSITVGAAFFGNTPAFSTVLETAVIGFDGAPFAAATRSSVGGAPIIFDENGNRIPELIREVPAFVGPDGSATTFFGRQEAGQFRFFGTSAAAPIVAAAAALLLQASGKTYSPQQIRDVLAQTAIDMDDPYDNGLQFFETDSLFATGYDFATGFGYVQPLDAFEIVINDVGSEAISLEELCSENPSAERRWQFNNPNGFAIEVNITSSRSIRLPGETTFGASSRTYNVPPGESFIWTDIAWYSTSTFLSVTYEPVGAFGIGRISKRVRGSVEACTQSRAVAGTTVDESPTRQLTGIAYPNPSADGKFFLNIHSELSEDHAVFQVYDMSGKELLTQFQQQLNPGNNRIEVSLGNYAKGLYLLKVASGSLNSTQRLQIE